MSLATPSEQPHTNTRLLYRGALSLPDSHILLDGLSFTTRTGDGSESPAPALIDNPLALSLESMRGRPSLHHLGQTRLKDVWIDAAAAVDVDVHPLAMLTKMYLENILCLTPIATVEGRTEYGVRVGLTDDNDPDTPDLLIYGQLKESMHGETAVSSTSAAPPRTLHLFAARILPRPPPATRVPRPDDPTPRKPPLAFGAKRKREPAGIPFSLDNIKRTKTTPNDKGKSKADKDEAIRRAAEVMRRMPKPAAPVPNVGALGKDARVGQSKDVFKVPKVPTRAREDVFGELNGDGLNAVPDALLPPTETEKENKTAVKIAVSESLAKLGVTKTHGEFRGLFQTCYQGTSFALRHQMAVAPIDARTIKRFVDAHTRLYVCDAPTQ